MIALPIATALLAYSWALLHTFLAYRRYAAQRPGVARRSPLGAVL